MANNQQPDHKGKNDISRRDIQLMEPVVRDNKELLSLQFVQTVFAINDENQQDRYINPILIIEAVHERATRSLVLHLLDGQTRRLKASEGFNTIRILEEIVGRKVPPYADPTPSQQPLSTERLPKDENIHPNE